MTELSDLFSTPLPKAARLSKSKFLSGLQCHKRLYLEVHQPSLATKPDAATQAMFDMGTEVGELARSRFIGGVLVTAGYRQSEAALAQTAELIQNLAVPAIFEGAFLHGGVLVRADVLERVQTTEGQFCGWRLIEVKSSTRVKDVHLEDLAVQSEVILGAGLTLVSISLMHINTGYLYREGAIDLTELFSIQDLSEAVAQRRAEVPARLAGMSRMLLQAQPPAIEPDQHCHTPYDCPFWEHCTKDKPARWIHYLPGSKQVVSQLTLQGVTTIDEIPAGAKLSPVQRRVKENVEWVSAKLGPVLKAVQYPVALGDQPSSKTALYLGNAYLKLDQLGKAKEALELALKLDPQTKKRAMIQKLIEVIDARNVGVVKIESTPAGASVHVDGEEGARGKTPLELSLAPGVHKLMAELEGHRSATEERQVQSGETSTVALTLAEIGCDLTLTAEPTVSMGALDGAAPVKLPAKLQVSPGVHSIVISAPAYERKTETVTCDGKTPLAIQAALNLVALAPAKLVAKALLSPEQRRTRRKRIVWGLIGGGGALVVAGVVVGVVLGVQKHDPTPSVGSISLGLAR